MRSIDMYKHAAVYRYVVCVLLCTAFFSTGWFLSRYMHTHTETVRQVRGDAEGYQFINPLLYIDNSELTFKELEPLQDSVRDYIDASVGAGHVADVGFYFRDLSTGSWTGVHENHTFAPASMLKVATLVAYLKMAQNNPNILLEKNYYNPEEVMDQTFKPSQYLSKGEKTNRELLSQMIIESDNAAMFILDKGHVDEKLEIYEDLKLPNPFEEASQDFLSPMQYSRILRTLYNSSYLSRLYSEEALKLLSYTKFDKGIRAGVQKDVTVSHKFGEYTLLQSGKLVRRELHDCGIVYYPQHNYLICVMTKGDDFDKLSKVLEDISRITFNYVVRATAK